MRITSGELRGRVLKVPRAGGLRPTQDMVRESLFAMLGERLPGAGFLDLYAGTGAVGIEAWSRGAARVCWVESGSQALRALEENVRTLCPGAGRIVRGDVARALRQGLPGAPFDVIFADPPYAQKSQVESRRSQVADRRGTDWAGILGAVRSGGLLKAGGWMIMEQGADEPAVVPVGWLLVRDRRYGSTRLRVLELTGAGGEAVADT